MTLSPSQATQENAGPDDGAPGWAPKPKRTISLFTAISIVVSNMIGTGIFTSLGFQVAGLPSPFVILALWIIGGLCALCGAFAYAELAAALPRSGGEYNLLSKSIHPIAGFLAGWISATFGFAAPIALSAIAFGVYGNHALPGLNPLALSLLVVWGCSAVHFSGIRRGSAFQNAFTVLKVLLIIGFIVAGLCVSSHQPVTFLPQAGDWHRLLGNSFAISLIYVMYAYSGWNAATYIVGEIRDPRRNVPRSLLLGTVFVITLYVVVNAVFLWTTPMTEMAASAAANQPNVASLAGVHIFGAMGGRVADALICIGLISTISSMVWIGPRVTVAMGEDLPALRLLGRTTRNGIPRIALALQLLITTGLLLRASFETITLATQFALTACSFLTVVGLFVLRLRRPDLHRPYRAWGYPVTPLLFLGVSAWMIIQTFSSHPRESLLGLGATAAGLLFYFGSRRRGLPKPADRQPSPALR